MRIIASIALWSLLSIFAALGLDRVFPQQVKTVELSKPAIKNPLPKPEIKNPEFDEALDVARDIHHSTAEERDLYAYRYAIAKKTITKIREIVKLMEEVKCELKSSH